jgi:hypothetical protein
LCAGSEKNLPICWRRSGAGSFGVEPIEVARRSFFILIAAGCFQQAAVRSFRFVGWILGLCSRGLGNLDRFGSRVGGASATLPRNAINARAPVQSKYTPVLRPCPKIANTNAMAMIIAAVRTNHCLSSTGRLALSRFIASIPARRHPLDPLCSRPASETRALEFNSDININIAGFKGEARNT